MNLFISQTIKFLLYFIIVIIILTSIPISEKAIIYITKDTVYEKIAWNLSKLKNVEQIEGATLFIGPSFIQGSINDSLLSLSGRKHLNFGVKYLGSDLDYYFTKRVLAVSKPSRIYLCRPKDGCGIFHPMMPLLMSPLEYFFTFKQFPLNNFVTYVPKRIFFFFESLFYLFPSRDIQYTPSAWGFRGEINSGVNLLKDEDRLINDEINQRILNKSIFYNQDGSLQSLNILKSYWRKLRLLLYGGAEPVRDKTLNICQLAGVSVSEIYIPQYIDALTDRFSNEKNYFQRPVKYDRECLLLENYSFLSDNKLWIDYHHLNSNGADLFTKSIASYLGK